MQMKPIQIPFRVGVGDAERACECVAEGLGRCVCAVRVAVACLVDDLLSAPEARCAGSGADPPAVGVVGFAAGRLARVDGVGPTDGGNPAAGAPPTAAGGGGPQAHNSLAAKPTKTVAA